MQIKNAIENTKDSGMNELVCLFLAVSLGAETTNSDADG